MLLMIVGNSATSDESNSTPALIISGACSVNAINMLLIISGIFSMRIGIAFINPSASPIFNSIPLCISIGRISIKVDSSVYIASIAAGISSGKACPKPVSKSFIACMPDCIKLGPAYLKTDTITCGICIMVLETIGIKFCKNVIRVVLRFCSIGPMS